MSYTNDKASYFLSENERKGMSMRTIRFNRPFYGDHWQQFALEKLEQHHHENAQFELELRHLMIEHLQLSSNQRMVLTQSATHALEIMALALGLGPGDEVILPSYTYAATANAFARCGAQLVFADVHPDTVNIHPEIVADLISPKTKAIVPIHYGGYAADMKGFEALIKGTGIHLLEDAAHGVGASYAGMPLGTLGTMGCLSFHHTKNLTSGGFGGCLYIREAAETHLNVVHEILYQGTDQWAFHQGKVDHYRWNRLGGEYAMQPYNRAMFSLALPHVATITQKRKALAERYDALIKTHLSVEVSSGRIHLPFKINDADENGHIFYLRLETAQEREKLQTYLMNRGVAAYTHYEPLHLSGAGKRYGTFKGAMTGTRKVSEGLLRLPMFFELTEDEQEYVVECLRDFYRSEG